MTNKVTRQVEQNIKEKIKLYSKHHAGVVLKDNGKVTVVAITHKIQDVFRKVLSKVHSKDSYNEIDVIDEIISLRDMCNKILEEIDK